MINGILRYDAMNVVWKKEMDGEKKFRRYIWPHVCIFCKFGFAGPGAGYDSAFCSDDCMNLAMEIPREYWKD